jgi:cytochrome P450
MIPYETTQSRPVSPHYIIPKDVMVLPSFYSAVHDSMVYPNPDSFNPDRWITGDAASKKKSYLVFGAGLHKCLARRLVALTLGTFVCALHDVRRTRRSDNSTVPRAELVATKSVSLHHVVVPSEHAVEGEQVVDLVRDYLNRPKLFVTEEGW